MLFSLLIGSAQAETNIYVQNNTPHTITVNTKVEGPPLKRGAWSHRAIKVQPYERKGILRLQRRWRKTGHKRKKSSVFKTRLTIGQGPALEIRQRLRRRPIGPKLQMWQSAGKSPWVNDRRPRTMAWAAVKGQGPLVVRWRGYFGVTVGIAWSAVLSFVKK